MRWFLALCLLIGACSACTKVVKVPVVHNRVVKDTVFVDTRMWGAEPSAVTFDSTVIAELSQRWINNESVRGPEFVACLEAEVERDVLFTSRGVVPLRKWRVTDYTIAEDSLATRKTTSASCEGYEGRAHSHPILTYPRGPFRGKRGITCHRSHVDRKSFWSEQMSFEVVLCGPRSYRWYTRNGEQGGVNYGGISWTVPYSPLTDDYR